MKHLLTALLTVFFTGLFAAPAQADSAYDRTLTKSEIKKLLPKYVAMVEDQAAELPSVSENQNIAVTAAMTTDPVYGAFKGNRIVGLQSHKIETIIKELETL